MNHKNKLQLIISWTLTLVFVFTACVTALSLVGWLRFENPKQQEKLFYVLIVQVVAVGVGYFRGFIRFGLRKETRHLPEKKQFASLFLIHGNDEIFKEMMQSVVDAKDYIFTIGGRSRNQQYLITISKRVQKGDIHYIRVILGDHIRHILCDHLRGLKDIVDLGYHKEERFGNVTVTHDTTFIALQDPEKSSLYRVIRIRDKHIANEFRQYISEVLGSSNTNIDDGFIRQLCKDCRTKEAQQPHAQGRS